MEFDREPGINPEIAPETGPQTGLEAQAVPEGAWNQERDLREERRKDAPALARGLGILFWVSFPAVLGSLLSNETFSSPYFPGMKTVGTVLVLACNAVQLYALWTLARVSERYRDARSCAVGALVMLLAARLLPFVIQNPWGFTQFALALLLMAAILQIIATYKTYYGTAEQVEGLDDALARRWRLLWKWFFGLVAALFGLLVLMLFLVAVWRLSAARFLLYLMLGIAIGLLVVSILVLIAYYRSAKLFRALAREAPRPPEDGQGPGWDDRGPVLDGGEPFVPEVGE